MPVCPVTTRAAFDRRIGPRRRRGFSIVELLIVILLMAVLAAILVPVLSSARRQAAGGQCLSNLHQLACAFDVYAQANAGRLPDSFWAGPWDDLLTPHLSSDGVFRCLSDTRYEQTRISYDWRDDFAVADPRCSLSGRRKAQVRQADLILVFESMPDRHQEGQVNAAVLDGAAASYSLDDFHQNLETPVEAGQPSLFEQLVPQ